MHRTSTVDESTTTNNTSFTALWDLVVVVGACGLLGVRELWVCGLDR